MRKLTVLLFGSMLLLSLTYKVMSKEKCPIITNGCSVPGGLPFFYKKTFTPACVKHDVCYSCGQHYGWSRYDCDKAFKKDMYRICKKKFGRKKRWFSLLSKIKRCRHFANLYYLAVRVAGDSNYDIPSERWCKQNCTQDIGDPSKPLEV